MSVVVIKDSKLYLVKDSTIQPISFKEAKKHLVGARVPLKEIIALNFKLPLNLTTHQLTFQIELKMYNEGGLNPKEEYVIDFISYPLEEFYLIEAFAIPKKRLIALFGEYAKKIGFIDIIYPRFITYTTLSREDTSLIFYLSTQEAFFTFYQKGNYLGHRSVDSLEKLAKEVGVEVEKLKTLLSDKGLKSQNYSPTEQPILNSLQQLFFKNVQKVLHTLNLKRGVFKLEKIDSLLIDFEGKRIPGLVELFLSFGVEGELRYEVLKQPPLLLDANYIQQSSNLPQTLNFSIFERKKPLLEYESLKAFLIVMVAFGVVGVETFFLKEKLSLLKEELEFKKQQVSLLKRGQRQGRLQLKTLKERKTQLSQTQKSLLKEIELYTQTLNTIPSFWKEILARQKLVNDTIHALYLFKLNSKSLEQNRTSLVVDILSQKEQPQQIAKFVSTLLNKGYNPQLDKILKKEELYESFIRIER